VANSNRSKQVEGKDEEKLTQNSIAKLVSILFEYTQLNKMVLFYLCAVLLLFGLKSIVEYMIRFVHYNSPSIV
jgi:hypothetical protein